MSPVQKHFNASPEPGNARRKSIVEDHLRKVGCGLGRIAAVDYNGRTIWMQTHSAITESISLCVRIRNSLRLWNLKATHRAAGKVKPVYAKNTKWLLFNSNQLQKFPQ
jgi:hypothetical protein